MRTWGASRSPRCGVPRGTRSPWPSALSGTALRERSARRPGSVDRARCTLPVGSGAGSRCAPAEAARSLLASLANRTRSLDGRSLSRCRPSCGIRSPEGRFAVPAPLELEEAVRPGDHDQAVPESSGSFTARGWCDHGAEQGRAADAENGRPDIEADLVERLVVRVLDEWIELRACGGRGQRAGQARLRESFGDNGGIVATSLVVKPGAYRGVQRSEDAAAIVLSGCR